MFCVGYKTQTLVFWSLWSRGADRQINKEKTVVVEAWGSAQMIEDTNGRGEHDPGKLW